MLIWSVVGRGPSMVEAQWSTVVAGGCVVLDGQGSTLDASRLAVDGVPTESDRMESNKKVTVSDGHFLIVVDLGVPNGVEGIVSLSGRRRCHGWSMIDGPWSVLHE